MIILFESNPARSSWIKVINYPSFNGCYPITVQMVHQTPKHFSFQSNAPLPLFQTHYTFLFSFYQLLMFCKFQNLGKTKHYLFQVSLKGMDLFLFWYHKIPCMHVCKIVKPCKLVSEVKSGIDPCLSGSSWNKGCLH